ncbi:hypothetical protein LCGC14_2557680 [marine sediment metagenome]|uniref:Uncharacterized protein n=1 Tax=marine sediment metagenome TaxID=412755 RepID=A0A0F9CXB4_9ZZZZ
MKEKEEFTTLMYESITFSVSADRKTIKIYDNFGSVRVKLSSAGMYILCKSIVDLLEKEESAYDLWDQEILIPLGKPK